MTTLVTRAGKGSPLTNTEMDTNLTNLNSDKTEVTTLAASGGAALVGNTPAGSIAATTVQAAINELDTEKAALAGSASQTFSVAAATAAGHAVRLDQIKWPVCSAYLTANQTGLTNSVWTKVLLDAVRFDSTSAFDIVTNRRYTPLVAGYYTITIAAHNSATTAITASYIALYKNGASVATSGGPVPSLLDISLNKTCIVYMNGSTDYLELWSIIIGTGTLGIYGGGAEYLFDAVLSRLS